MIINNYDLKKDIITYKNWSIHGPSGGMRDGPSLVSNQIILIRVNISAFAASSS